MTQNAEIAPTEWHVAVHADSDSLFRHSGALSDCAECCLYLPEKD